ncbi:MAG TPA: hypothetical protein VGJ93_15260 [Desulfuromonadaceae bacterium]|jgi:hypothetical protein
MSKFICLVLLHCFFLMGSSFPVQAEDGFNPVHVAFFELSRLRLLCLLDGTYKEYGEVLTQAQEQFYLVQEASSGVEHLRMALSYYEQALLIWQKHPSVEPPVESLRVDESNQIKSNCTEVEFSRAAEEDVFLVNTAIACLWNKAAEELDEVPAFIH